MEDIWRGIPSSPLESRNSQTMSGVACHHRPWMANTVQRRRVRHAIIVFGLADTLTRRRVWHAIIALGWETWSNDVERGMPSPPWDSTHGHTTSGVACHHRLLAAQTVIRRRPWHAITALGQHTRSDYVRRGMTSPPLYSTHGRMTLCVACHHRL